MASKFFCGLFTRKSSPSSSSSSSSSKRPKEKLRWSFLKCYRKKNNHHHHNHEAAVAADQAAAAISPVTNGTSSLVAADVSGRGAAIREELAAVKLQSAFRGYLARKALRALKGLVKFQALVRGHIVRKWMDECLHRMQALMQAQARAISERCQVSKFQHSTSSKSSNPEHGSNRTKNIPALAFGERRVETDETDEHEMAKVRSLGTPKQGPQYERSGETKRYSDCPNYMACTESSKAKVRSLKQRPQYERSNSTKRYLSSPPIAPAPWIASSDASVSNMAAKVLANLQIKGSDNNGNEHDHGGTTRPEASCETSPERKMKSELNSPNDSNKSIFDGVVDTDDNKIRRDRKKCSSCSKGKPLHECCLDYRMYLERASAKSVLGCPKVVVLCKRQAAMRMKQTQKQSKPLGNCAGKDEVQRYSKQFPSSEGSTGSHGSSSSKRRWQVQLCG